MSDLSFNPILHIIGPNVNYILHFFKIFYGIRLIAIPGMNMDIQIYKFR